MHCVRGGVTVLVAVMVLGVCARVSGQPPPLEQVKTIPLKGPRGPLGHLAIDSERHRLLVANTPNDTLDVIDLASGQLVKQVTGQKGIGGVAYASGPGKIFVCGPEMGVQVLDGKDYATLKRIELPKAGVIQYHAGTNRIYVTHADYQVAVFDARTLEGVGEIGLTAAPAGFYLERRRPRMYVNTEPPTRVLVIDTTTNQIADRYAVARVAGNQVLAMDEGNHRLFIGCREPAVLVVMDGETGRLVSQVPISGRVGDVWFDGSRVYASCGDGYVMVIRQIDLDRYDLVAKIETGRGAATSCWDGKTGNLYVAVPGGEGRSQGEVWVYRSRSP